MEKAIVAGFVLRVCAFTVCVSLVSLCGHSVCMRQLELQYVERGARSVGAVVYCNVCVSPQASISICVHLYTSVCFHLCLYTALFANSDLDTNVMRQLWASDTLPESF